MKKFLIFILLFILNISPLFSYFSENTSQIILVLVEDLNSICATTHLLEKDKPSSAWRVCESMPAVTGRRGVAVGSGMENIFKKDLPQKVEGDRKTPLGIFPVGEVFGFTDTLEIKMPYRQITEMTEAIDDPESAYYNLIVEADKVSKKDWISSEIMSKFPQYDIGFVVNYNRTKPEPKRGSCHFFNLWITQNNGTLGCTALARKDLKTIIYWLDEKKEPHIIQTLASEYEKVRDMFSLPNLF